MATTGLISYRFRDKRRFQSKIANGPVYFTATDELEGVLLELGISACGSKTRIMGLPGRERCLMISSAVWIQTDTMHVHSIHSRANSTLGFLGNLRRFPANVTFYEIFKHFCIQNKSTRLATANRWHLILGLWCKKFIHIYRVRQNKVAPNIFCSFLSNRLEFKREILHTCLVISCEHNSLNSM